MYIIVGDTKDYKDCLVCICGGNDKDYADQYLKDLLNCKRKLEGYKESIDNYSNLHVENTTPENEWWKDPFLAN